MRRVNTIVCTALTALIVCSVSASSDENEPHFTAAEFLVQSPRQQRMFAVATVLATGLAIPDRAAGKCIVDWYFDDETEAASRIVAALETNPDVTPTTVIVALADQACGGVRQPPRAAQ